MKAEWQIFWIACGGSLGALTRYGLYVWLSPDEASYSWGTLTANTIGCFFAGLIIGCGGSEKSEWIRLCVSVGFLGALTTFSSFGVETVRHLRGHQFSLAFANIATNLVLGLVMVWLGVLLGAKWKS
jgi:fluoride exporter